MIIPYYCEDYPEDPPEPHCPTPKKDSKNAEQEEKQQSKKLQDETKTPLFTIAKPQSEMKKKEN